ncbi:thiosulfate sulfurtransferase [Thalassotalea sp. 42_200_T64]|nr:thiosulfate sulfurtransferase [Thalassotalea sp. 42_200_T64]
MLTDDTQFKHINVEQVHSGLSANKYVVVDIRDANAFGIDHIPGAIHLTNDSVSNFLRDADFDAPTVVCCYHGISSQQAAQFLIGHDFSDVYSLDGGFELWGNTYPSDVEPSDVKTG